MYLYFLIINFLINLINTLLNLNSFLNNCNELAELYKDKADLIVNAGLLKNKMHSTLYDCLENKVLRQGFVHLD